MKKVLAIMLVCLMLVSLLPMGAFAADETSNCPGTGNKHYLELMNPGEYVSAGEVTSTACGGFNYKLWKCLKCDDLFASDVTSNGETCEYVKVEDGYTAPTCTEAGSQEYKCSKCGTTKTEVIPALGHTLETATTGDCTTGVSVTTTCKVCEEVITTVAGQSGHNFPKVPVISEDEQWAYYGCQNAGCGYVKNVPIYCHIYTEEFEYNVVHLDGKAPTCTEEGYTESIVCKVHGEEIVPAKTIDKVPCDKNGKVFKVADAPIVLNATSMLARYTLPTYDEDTVVTFYTQDPDFVSVDVQKSEDGENYEPYYIGEEDGTPGSIEYVDENEDGVEDGVTFMFRAGMQYRLSLFTWSYPLTVNVYMGSFVEGCIENPGDCEDMPYLTWNCSMCGNDWNEYYCNECGAINGDCDCDELKKQNHNLELMKYIPATCTTHGFIVYGCVDCGKINNPEDQVIDPINHKNTKLVGKTAPTCTQPGYTGDTVCKDCGEVMEKGEVIDALDHTWGTYTIPGNCNTPSYTYEYCTVKDCDGMVAPSIFDGNADFSIPNSKNHVVKQYSLVVGEKNPDEHTWGTHKYLNEDTCTEVGVIVYYCDYCSEYYAEVVDKIKNHTWEELGEAPTCGTAGWTQKQCKTCGELTEKVELPAQPATENGIKQNGTAYTEAEANDVHNFGDNEKVVIREGNCDIIGLYERKCNDCGIEILIIEPETGTHKKPTNLGKYDSNWQPLYTDAQVAVAKYLHGVYDYEWAGAVLTFTPDAENPTIGTVEYYYAEYDYNTGIESKFEGKYAYVVHADGVVETTYVKGDELADGMNISIGTNWMGRPVLKVFKNQFAVNEEMEINVPVQQHAYTDSTCAEYGWTEQWYCERCDVLVKTAERIEKKEHVLVDATCDKPGHCKNCETMHKDPNGHKWGEETVVEATCTTAGYTTKTCETCGTTDVSGNVAALGHNVMPVYMQKHIEIVDVKNGWYQIGFVQYECVNCGDGFGDETNGYGFIVDYKGIDCYHEFYQDDFNNTPAVDCQTPNKLAYTCEHCYLTVYVDGDKYAPHKNEKDEALFENDCTNKVEGTRVCDTCEQTIELKKHDFEVEGYVPVSYPATCQNVAYDMYQCACGESKVVKTGTEKGEHTYVKSDEPLTDENGVPTAYSYTCKYCMDTYVEYITEVIYTATIDNALKAGAYVVDGGRIAVTINVSGSEDDVWGFRLMMEYSSNLKYDGYKYESANFNDTYTVNNVDGKVVIVANADEKVIVDDAQAIVTLYFVVDASENAEVSVNILSHETLDSTGKPVEATCGGDKAAAYKLMDLDGNNVVNMMDAKLAYALITDVNAAYDARLDLNRDGSINPLDYKLLYEHLAMIKDYEQIAGRA